MLQSSSVLSQILSHYQEKDNNHRSVAGVYIDMSTQKILINYEEFKKLKQIEQKYHELLNSTSGIFNISLVYLNISLFFFRPY